MDENSTEFWRQSAEQMQKTMAGNWTQAMEALQQLIPVPLQSVAPPDAQAMPALKFSPAKLQLLQQQYLQEAGELWSQTMGGKPVASDRRFADQAWSTNPIAAFSAATTCSTRAP